MSDPMLLGLGVFVFVMLCIGLGLTVWEFTRGEPHQEQKMAERADRRLNEAA